MQLARDIVPQGHMEKNCFGETPEMVFTKEHKELVIESGNWMKSTAKSHALTATLIITVVFAAAITIPGGTNEKNHGVPNFNDNPAFIIFEASIAISMLTSSLSLLLFLSILTSRLTEHDFLFRLPLTLVMGLGNLFVSATSTMLAFGAALFLIFGSKHPWTAALIAPMIGLIICFSIFFHSSVLPDFLRSAGQLLIIPLSVRFNMAGRIFI
ncbi:putative PGG domain-containing protein [Helianthus annuus]|nr:putative PGG domain-containing protein [Helianthus annuus]